MDAISLRTIPLLYVDAKVLRDDLTRCAHRCSEGPREATRARKDVRSIALLKPVWPRDIGATRNTVCKAMSARMERLDIIRHPVVTVILVLKCKVLRRVVPAIAAAGILNVVEACQLVARHSACRWEAELHVILQRTGNGAS